MHDAKGRELKVGDTVVVPCKVVSCAPGEYCTLSVETLGVMPGNGIESTFSALNTKQVYRANIGDDTQIVTTKKDGKTHLS